MGLKDIYGQIAIVSKFFTDLACRKQLSLLGKFLQLTSFLEVQMGTGKFNAGGNPAMEKHPINGGLEILLNTGYRNWHDKPLGPFTDLRRG